LDCRSPVLQFATTGLPNCSANRRQAFTLSVLLTLASTRTDHNLRDWQRKSGYGTFTAPAYA
jgi:hypothetical protein